MPRLFSSTFVALALLIAGCGGGSGGSGGSTVPVTPTYAVTATASSGGTIGPASSMVQRGQVLSLAVTPDPGHLVTSATGCGGSLSGGTYVTGPIQGPCTVTVNFAPQVFSISASASDGGSISPAEVSAQYGSRVAFTLTPEEGHGIQSVSGCAGSLAGTTYTTGPVGEDCAVTATFALNRYAVNAVPGPGGLITPASALVSHGSTASFEVSTLAGYHLVSMSGCDGVLTGNTYTTGRVTAPCTITASFAFNSYRVVATAGPGGDVQPREIVVTHGSTARFTVTTDPGYLIREVNGCGGALQDGAIVTAPVTGPCTLMVLFRRPQVSGSIIPRDGTAVDGDVNDPRAPYRFNGALSQGQLLPGSVTLGGYVNRPLAGPDGRSYASGDTHDYYRLGLEGGQEIILEIASEHLGDDLDLYLLDLDGAVLDASLDVAARVESVRVPADAAGEYLVLVHAWDGASRYLLRTGPPRADAVPTARLSDDFVPGDIIVRPAAGQAQIAASRNMLVRVDEMRAARELPATAVAAERIAELKHLDIPFRFRNAGDASKLETLLVVKALAGDPGVGEATPNYLHRLPAELIPDDPLYGQQWHYPLIQLPAAWPLADGAGTIVAVIDSGVFLDHPDLAGQLVGGYDFIRGVPGGDDPGGDFHGTHVAGTVAAATGNGIGVAGVAHGARIMPLRVCNDSGACPGYAIEQALRFAAGLPNDSGTTPDRAADVVNLSLGRGGPALSIEQTLYDQLRALDISVVASAGNSSSSTPSYPAAYRNVLAVSSVDLRREQAYYSNYGPWIDVAAPGGDSRVDRDGDGFVDGVLSTVAQVENGSVTPGYARFQGTSMAAPHVAGVVALMRSASPELSAQDVEHLLRNGAITDDLGAAGHDNVYGHGLINALKAVGAALAAGGEPVELDPFMVALPAAVELGWTLSQQTVLLINAGGGELNVGSPVEDSGGWLTATLEPSDDRTLLRLEANREGLVEGAYTATVTVPSNANTVEITVSMGVAVLPPGDVGMQYVLLADPDSLATKLWTIAQPGAGGRLTFVIENVMPGEYALISGSDHDNDFYICGPGESCGVYRQEDGRPRIVVGVEDIGGLQIESGYEATDVSLPASAVHGIVLDRRTGAE